MKDGKALIIFIGVASVLLFAFQVLAQSSVESWDKAMSGMSAEELKDVYKEEVKFRYDSEERLSGVEGEPSRFGKIHFRTPPEMCPYELWTEDLKMFREKLRKF